MIVILLTEHNLEFLSLKRGCRGPSESTLVKSLIVGNLMHWLKFIIIIIIYYIFQRILRAFGACLEEACVLSPSGTHCLDSRSVNLTLVNVYVDLVVFTRIAGTS